MSIRMLFTLFVVFLISLSTVVSAQRPHYEYPLEVDDVYIAKRSADFYRSMFKRANAQKRERIVMDALGGDFLVRKRSLEMERRR
ncbi:hypothetical protein L596_006569 [Steinernema carpocapsae]|uniref:Uncharacterized protein n=1 Tax=Steinernema carpocapsae TaxID=34508 RepID=A0A4U8V2J3_STECR|nr:hypothetical protein L596_006569 [Steinernema carpocapsae]